MNEEWVGPIELGGGGNKTIRNIFQYVKEKNPVG